MANRNIHVTLIHQRQRCNSSRAFLRRQSPEIGWILVGVPNRLIRRFIRDWNLNSQYQHEAQASGWTTTLARASGLYGCMNTNVESALGSAVAEINLKVQSLGVGDQLKDMLDRIGERVDHQMRLDRGLSFVRRSVFSSSDENAANTVRLGAANVVFQIVANHQCA
jgi:hypothetical protein